MAGFQYYDDPKEWAAALEEMKYGDPYPVLNPESPAVQEVISAPNFGAGSTVDQITAPEEYAAQYPSAITYPSTTPRNVPFDPYAPSPALFPKAAPAAFPAVLTPPPANVPFSAPSNNVTPLPRVIRDEPFEAEYLAWKGRNPGKTIADFLAERKATADPYAAFKAKWAREFPDEPLTQDILNDNAGLVKRGISNDLFRLLPLDRQMGFDSKRLALLDHADLQRLVEHNPQVAGAFPTAFWKTFSNDWLAKVVGPFFQKANPAEWTNIVNQNQIGGANAGALPPELQPSAAPTTVPPAAGTPPPQEAPPGGVSGPPPPAPAASYAGPGQFAIPRAQQPALPSDIASRSALEQYYAMLGYGNVARPPAAATTAPPTAAGAATFPDFATWQTQNPGKTYDDYFAARSAVVPPSGRTGTLAGIGDIETGENLTLPEGFELGTMEPTTTPTTTPAGGGFVDIEGNPIPDYPSSPLDVRYRQRSDGSTETLTPTYENVQELIPVKDPETGAIISYEKGTTTRLVWKSSVRTPSAGRAPATPEQQAQDAANLQHTNAQIAALEARVRNDEAQLAEAIRARQFSEQIAIQDRLDKAKADLQNYTLQRDQLVQRQAEFGAELTQRQAEFGATATGMIGGQPTLQREVAISQADLANKRQQADNAVNAANIALKQGDQAEARRQFDIAQRLRGEIERGQLALSTRAQTEAERAGEFGRGLATEQFGLTSEIQRGQLGLGGRAQTESELQGAANRATQAGQLALAQGNAAEAKRQFDIAQGLTERIQTGQLGLATRAQTEAERAGEFGRGLETARFRREVEQSPASFTERAYRARGIPPPAATTVPPAVAQVGAPPEAARVAGTLATTQAPLTAGEIKANVGPGLARTLEGQAPGEFFSEIPRLSAQRFNLLMPSEREEYRAAALASGTSPADLEEEIRRRSQTGTPSPAVATRTRAAPRARLY